jgi:hypothetical protein
LIECWRKEGQSQKCTHPGCNHKGTSVAFNKGTSVE